MYINVQQQQHVSTHVYMSMYECMHLNEIERTHTKVKGISQTELVRTHEITIRIVSLNKPTSDQTTNSPSVRQLHSTTNRSPDRLTKRFSTLVYCLNAIATGARRSSSSQSDKPMVVVVESWNKGS
uniref:Uncharacterized protein n=1 Tax=Ceratitis capitata TaxID=7213 RepID=W8AJJ1_CERCA